MAATRTRRPFTALDQDARTARALAQMGDYTFTQLQDGSWRCEGPNGAYRVTEGGECSCGDATYTVGPANGLCKHATMLGHWLLACGVGLQPAREEAACRRCGVIEPVEVLVALDDLGGYVCRDCYTAPAPCPKAGDGAHLGWYCPACLREQPAVAGRPCAASSADAGGGRRYLRPDLRLGARR